MTRCKPVADAMAMNGDKQDFHSRNGDLAKRRVTFKKASRDDLLTINVSGTIFYAQSSIFAKHPDTLLGSKRRDQFFDEKRNEYFFDRDPDLFSYILKFYRKGTLHYPEDECACSFKGELDFFGILKNNLSECCYEIFQEKHEEFEDYQRRHARTEDEDFVPKTLREKTWKLFEDPGKNIFGLFLHYTSAVLILISVVASTVETLQCGKVKCGNKYSEQFYVVESICVIAFTVEYIARLWAAPKRFQFMKQFLSIIDVVAIIPYYVALVFPDAAGGPFTVLRIFRIFRIVKMSRHNTKVREAGSSLLASLSELSFVFVVLVTLVILFSTVIYYAEMEDEDTKFKGIPMTFWYVIVTMTTLGYGDMTPTSVIGRLTGVICSLSGIMVVALPAPVLEKNFSRKSEEGRPHPAEKTKHAANSSKLTNRSTTVTNC
ncbi:A-type voltage-gated potassium channel KCND2-like isoform X1 [Acropora muricata]|uniref:A-type voltage-gated potassium channel KCND2-like isoform X1 n=2 Tax=Acropora muricata TaxID=159855 RepID=UPI0034E3ECAA